jgi:hypothetical protein
VRFTTNEAKNLQFLFLRISERIETSHNEQKNV